jgi:hypothetical protein
VDGRRLDEWANQFFIAQESTLSYDSTLLSLLYESASPTVRVRFMPATSIHDSATGEALIELLHRCPLPSEVPDSNQIAIAAYRSTIALARKDRSALDLTRHPAPRPANEDVQPL